MRPLLQIRRMSLGHLPMKCLLLSFGLFLVGLFSSAAFAQQDMPMHKMAKSHMAGGGHAMHEMMDTNKDSTISRDEFKTFHGKNFSKADKNGDGSLDAQEFALFSKIMAEERAKAMEIAKQKRMKRHFDKLDADKNGKISKAEFEAMGERHFSRMDRNGDGKLSQDDHGNRMSGMSRPGGDADE